MADKLVSANDKSPEAMMALVKDAARSPSPGLETGHQQADVTQATVPAE